MQKNKRPIWEHYSPKAIQLGCNEFDATEKTKAVVAAYVELSTEFHPASWEQIAEKLNLAKNRSTQTQIAGSLGLCADAYKNLCAQPHPYKINKQEE